MKNLPYARMFQPLAILLVPVGLVIGLLAALLSIIAGLVYSNGDIENV